MVQAARLSSRLGLFSLVTPSLAYTWPDKTDFLESLYYQQLGYHDHQFGIVIKSCAFKDNLPETGRTNTAEWIRAAYHDMATANLDDGTGGLDASITFELDRSENVGKGFLDAFKIFLPFMSARSSMADLIALGATMSVTACTLNANGPPVYIPFRGGRIDATGPGPTGVPRPEEDLDTHTSKFAKQGFNDTEMIALVACGHSLGGVHGADFPEIVPVLNDPTNMESRQNFDGSVAQLDNSVATQFLQNSTQNALAFGPNETTRSDFRIFNSDGGSMIGRMAASNDFFLNTCSSLMERMLNTVPKDVALSDIIVPVPVKPDNINIAVDANGNMTITGEIRVQGFVSQNKVNIYLKPRTVPGASDYVPVAATYVSSIGGLYPYAPTFGWFKFNASVPAVQGLSSFDIEIIDSTGNSTIYNNGGSSFPLFAEIIPQTKLSCATKNPGYRMNVTAAILDDANFSSINFSVPIPLEQSGTIVPQFVPSTFGMEKIGTIEGTGYSLYSGAMNVTSKTFFVTMSYGLSGKRESGDVELPFLPWDGLGQC